MQWTVKYAPKSSQDLIGNATIYTRLIKWIKAYKVNRRSGKAFKHIAFMGGPPGIGKTSGIMAIAKQLNFEVIEFNASDQRNAEVITRLVSRASQTQPNIGFSGKIVLLDEVDGLSGREDRGGLGALLKIAKNAFHPIVCTANDHSNLNLRALKKESLFLDMKPPDRSAITNLLQNIAIEEGLIVDPIVFRAVSDNAHGDIRAALNDLENLASSRKNGEIPRQAIQALNIRDSKYSIEIALELIFGKARTLKQAHEITNNLDVDYSMFLNYVSENIPSHANNPKELAAMYDKAASADLIRGRIIFSQHWTLLKYFFFLLSAGIWSSKTSAYESKRIQFPTLLISLSQSRKVRGLRDDIARKIGIITHTSKSKVIVSTLPYLRLEYESLFDIFRKKDLESLRAKKLLHTLAFLQYQAEFTGDELLFLFNDPIYDKPTKTTESQQKVLIKQLEKQAELIKGEQILLTNEKFWEKHPISKFAINRRIPIEPQSATIPKGIKSSARQKSKGVKQSKKEKKPTSNLLKITRPEQDKKDLGEKKKSHKKLMDFF